jgi:shikimate dehydrogenase
LGKREVEGKKLYGLLGKNIDYSLSPVMHNAAFRYFGIDAEYVLFDTDEAGLEGFLNDMVLSGALAGLNITVPYKIKIKEKLESCFPEIEIDRWGRIVNAVNTARFTEGKAELWNTDMPGFLDSLNRDLGYITDASAGKRSCFIVGAGGAGRAIAFLMMSMAGPVDVYVHDVDREKLVSLERDIRSGLGETSGRYLKIVDANDALAGEIAECDLLVNATPIGTRENDPMPVPEGCLREGLSVYDLVYARETELVKKSRARGAKAVNGLGMLVRQGAISFNKWTGMEIEETAGVMREEIEKRWNT